MVILLIITLVSLILAASERYKRYISDETIAYILIYISMIRACTASCLEKRVSKENERIIRNHLDQIFAMTNIFLDTEEEVVK